ncbi:hypothetical protein EJ110_NYTH37363 [Nymphaea thermarum]|nr:hypothetical protein EJ110_NYTH37363 [Nymphaea thermarum]
MSDKPHKLYPWDVIERLVRLGLYYRKLTEFVAKSRNPNVAWITNPNVQNQAPASLKIMTELNQ